MNAVKEVIERVLRGPASAKLLGRLGIDPKRYWLLIDLFGELSERSEMLDQLGRDGVALKTAAWLYFGLSALFTFVLLSLQPPVIVYFSIFLMLSTFLLLSILLSETGNSLVNPVEGMVLVHQPINGATYTAAKLTHLLRIIGYLVPGLNAVPALGGLLLNGARWTYPFVHMFTALAAGLVMALLCCALFGWLLRFLPASRLKAAAQFAGALPFLGFFWFGPVSKKVDFRKALEWLPAEGSARWVLAVALGVAVIAIVVLGIRSLSADYLIRISTMTRGGSAARAKARRSGSSHFVTRLFAGQPGVAGFTFVLPMMLRDWQFRRQIIPALLPLVVALAPVIGAGWGVDPFLGKFTPIHFVPHIFGTLLFLVCNLLAYGSDYKGAWIFLLAPSASIGRFARGVYSLLWTQLILIPHLILLPLLLWSWGVPHALLFVAYSIVVASFYLALEIRLIDGAPFSKPVDPMRGAVQLPLMIMGGISIAIAVGLQYFLLFRSPIAVLTATLVSGVTAYLLTRNSLSAFEANIRYNLGLMSVESGTLYKEVN